MVWFAIGVLFISFALLIVIALVKEAGDKDRVIEDGIRKIKSSVLSTGVPVYLPSDAGRWCSVSGSKYVQPCLEFYYEPGV